MNIEMASILLNQASFLSVRLLRCNKSLATLLTDTDTIQAIRKSVCRRVAKEVETISYSIFIGGLQSERIVKSRKWNVNLTYYGVNVPYQNTRVNSEGSNIPIYSDEVWPALRMTRAFVVESSFGNVSIKSNSLVEKGRGIWTGPASHRYGFIHPSFGWEQGAIRFRYTKTTLPTTITSKEEIESIRKFFEMPIGLLKLRKREYRDKCLQRYTDLFYGDGKARPIHVCPPEDYP